MGTAEGDALRKPGARDYSEPARSRTTVANARGRRASVIFRGMRTTLLAAVTLGALALVPGLRPTSSAQEQDPPPKAVERVDTETVWKIRREATEHSQIMRTLHMLTDVYGPRLTGS